MTMYADIEEFELAGSLNQTEHLPSSPHGFVNEIGYDELTLYEIIGRGAYGTVQKAEWRKQMVAIKIPENQSETSEFRDEAQRLSIVQHKNIIQLFGTSVNGPKVCLVMELAECGSLHSLLHPPLGTEVIRYTFAHVLNWSLQCAEAVEYLHNIKPKAIIHRDLKPPNMLLTQSGTVLKICDFGTACHPHSEMSVNKGSASWMAPEVFEGTRYAEKCDVYSFGIILWEMITRKKPYDGTPFQIMWKVHEGTRPTPIKGIPSCLENLIQRCWEKEEKDRPAFIEIVKFLRKANLYVTGGMLPLMGCGQPARECSWGDSETKTSIPSSTTNEEVQQLIPNESPIVESTPTTPSTYRSTLSSSEYFTPRNGLIQLPPKKYNRPLSIQTPQDYDQYRSQWGLIPPELMPLDPIKDHTRSFQMYESYMEGLKKYQRIQENITFLKQRRYDLRKNIDEINNEQAKNSRFMADYITAQEYKQQLLDMHKTIKPLLENERAKVARSPLTNR